MFGGFVTGIFIISNAWRYVKELGAGSGVKRCLFWYKRCLFWWKKCLIHLFFPELAFSNTIVHGVVLWILILNCGAGPWNYKISCSNFVFCNLLAIPPHSGTSAFLPKCCCCLRDKKANVLLLDQSDCLSFLSLMLLHWLEPQDNAEDRWRAWTPSPCVMGFDLGFHGETITA